jgi:TrmH family RNA methyltransferase
VTGLSVNKIKWIRSLQQKKFRDELGLFVIEGEKIVKEALADHHLNIELIVHTDRFADFDSKNVHSMQCSESEFKRISALQNPQGCLAVIRKPIPRKINTSEQLTLVLDGIQDPGNFGSIIRCADWFGIANVVCSTDTVDCYNSKAIQASMGSVLRINVTYIDLESWLPSADVPVYGTLLSGKNIYEEELFQNALIVMGNEGNGIRESILPYISHAVTIPSFGGSESLNVSIATGIVVSEFKRRHISVEL